jgi:Pentapeptide repeats (8 copies)
MNQIQQTIRWWRINPLVGTLAALALIGLLITIVLGYLLNWEWTGLVGIPQNPETRTAWDWLDLLIIPLVLALGALWFNNQARKSEQAIAQDQAREEALQRYLDTMQELILYKGLRTSEKDAEIRDVARVRTLAVLRSLDENRKGQVARFLREADLIGRVIIDEAGGRQEIEPIIDLESADLSGANLSGVDLFYANLISANLSNAVLVDTNLNRADLTNADLSGAYLIRAHLFGAHLFGAHLRGANLSDAKLFGGLSSANLSSVSLLRDPISSDATHDTIDLSHTSGYISEAKGWTHKQLAQASSLVGAIMPEAIRPDRTVMTEEAWEEFKKRNRQ